MHISLLPLSFFTRFLKGTVFFTILGLILNLLFVFVVPLIATAVDRIKERRTSNKVKKQMLKNIQKNKSPYNKTKINNITKEWDKLENRCYSIITEANYCSIDLLKPYIVNEINYNKRLAPNDILELDIEKTALMMIYNITVENFINTGNYHIHYGVLNLQGEKLLKLAKYSINIALDKGYINFEEHQDCIKALNDNIAHLG